MSPLRETVISRPRNLPFLPFLHWNLFLYYSGISPSYHFCIGICSCPIVESPLLTTSALESVPVLQWNLPFCQLLSRICPCILSFSGISSSDHFCIGICSCPIVESPILSTSKQNLSLYPVLLWNLPFCTLLHWNLFLSYSGISPRVPAQSGDIRRPVPLWIPPLVSPLL